MGNLKSVKGLIQLSLVLILSITLFFPKIIFGYNKPWDQGHRCIEPNPGSGNWGRYGYDTTSPSDIKDGYTSKKCCELYCKICPVYAHTGRLQKIFTDLMVPGVGSSLNITRTYLSQEQSTSLLGYGWMFNFGKRLIILRNKANDKIVVVRQETGELNFFKEHSDGTFERLTTYGLTYNLIRNSDGTYSIVNRDGSKQHLNPDGKIIKITDKNGNELLFAYNSVGCLNRITNASGNYINFQLGPNGKIVSISDNLGRTVHYTYDDNGNLTAFTDTMGNITQYNYNSDRLLTRIIDSRGNIVESMTYDNHEPPRVSTFTEKGETYTIAYYSDHTTKTDSSGNSWTYYFNETGIIEKVIDPLGNVKQQHHNKITSTSMDWEEDLNGNRTTYSYDEYGNITSKTDPLGNTWNYTYVPGTNLVVTETNPLGIVKKYEYDLNGNNTKIIRDFGGSLEISTTFIYDSYGNMLSGTDPLGHTISYEYNINGKLVKMTDPLGNVTTYTYDNRGNKLSETDALGNTTAYAYDIMDHLLSVTDAFGNVTSYTYDENGNQISITNANGNTTIYTYDHYNRLIQKKDPLGNTTSYAYDSRDNCISITDANGNTTTYSYDILDRLITETDPLGGQTSYVYDAVGNILSITDANGKTTIFIYDKNNQKISETNAMGEKTTYAYDANGNQITQTSPNGNVVTKSYDSHNRLVSKADTIGLINTYTYDNACRILSESDSLGNIISYNYNAGNRLVKRTDSMGNITTFIHDAVGNLTSITDREGNTINFSFDSLGRRVSLTDQLGNTTTFSYDNIGNLISEADAYGNVTSYLYDQVNRLIRETYTDGTYRVYAYDNVGNIIQRIDQKGQTIQYVYDVLNRRIKIDYPDDNDNNYTFDSVGNLVAANNQNRTISFLYDNAYRLIQSIQNGKTVSYSYNISSNINTITYPSGMVIKEHRNLRDLLIQVEDGASQMIAHYTYNSEDRPLTRSFLNGITANFTYNANGQITDLTYFNGGSQLLGFKYAFDNEGNRLYSSKTHESSDSEQYIYDAKYRLIQFKRGILDNNGNIAAPVTQTSYNLDALSNWLSKTTDGITENRIHNGINEISSIDGVSYIYDDNGNLIDDGKNTYEYDYENRLVKVTRNSDSLILGEYKYDVLGRRVEKQASGITTVYYYDRERVLEEHVGGSLDALYVYGIHIDEVLVMNRAGNNYFYLSNSLGSIVALTDNSGNIIEEYSYDGYGKPYIFDIMGSSLTDSAIGNTYFFTGRNYDKESDLQYNRRRYFSSKLGRWLTQDPIGYIDSMNLFEYSKSNPINLFDPFGLTFVDGGRTGRDALYGHGGSGGTGGNAGVYTAIPPTYEWSDKCKCWITPGTGTVTVTRSYIGVRIGQQAPSGYDSKVYVPAATVAYIDSHEQDHINEAKRIHDAVIQPMERIIVNYTGTSKVLKFGTTKAECINELKKKVDWNDTLKNFKDQDIAANGAGGTIDRGVGIKDTGPKTIGGITYTEYWEPI